MTRWLMAATLLVSLAAPAQALEIGEYDRMGVTRRTAYLNDLVDATMRALYRDRQFDDYTRIRALFGYDTPGSLRIPPGLIELSDSIDALRETGRRNPERAVRVEDALAATLRNHGIEPPMDLMTLMDDAGSADAPQP